VRRLFHVLTSLGFALAVAPLALLASPSVPLATACLTAASALYACSFGGFHAYLQVGLAGWLGWAVCWQGWQGWLGWLAGWAGWLAGLAGSAGSE
jgi:hypothetical protein